LQNKTPADCNGADRSVSLLCISALRQVSGQIELGASSVSGIEAWIRSGAYSDMTQQIPFRPSGEVAAAAGGRPPSLMP
jgi:hypothetical protein